MEKINFENKKAPAINGSNLNKMQNNIEDGMQPIGSIYKSFNNVDPSTLFGGTWEVIACRELIEKGTSNGVDYEKYSDGYCVCKGNLTIASILGNSYSDNTINLPVTYTSEVYGLHSLTNGGANFAWASSWMSVRGKNATRLYVWNNNENEIKDLTYNWATAGYISEPTLFAWKRVS